MKLIAAFEALKAIIVLIAGVEALRFIHRDVRSVAEQLLSHLHLDPVARLPRLIIRLADQVSDSTLLMIAAGAVAYAALRFAEAYGLWRNLAWAKWLGVVSGGIYVPYELYQLGHGFTPLRIGTFLANVAIVVYLSWSLARTRREKGAGATHRRARMPPRK
jgi:uncharacterized membrane protein (DUF2068 family)